MFDANAKWGRSDISSYVFRRIQVICSFCLLFICCAEHWRQTLSRCVGNMMRKTFFVLVTRRDIKNAQFRTWSPLDILPLGTNIPWSCRYRCTTCTLWIVTNGCVYESASVCACVCVRCKCGRYGVHTHTHQTHADNARTVNLIRFLFVSLSRRLVLFELIHVLSEDFLRSVCMCIVDPSCLLYNNNNIEVLHYYICSSSKMIALH